MSEQTDRQNELEELAEKEQGFFAELLEFMFENKKWWLTPIVLVLVALAGLIFLGGGAAAPFIYTLF